MRHSKRGKPRGLGHFHLVQSWLAVVIVVGMLGSACSNSGTEPKSEPDRSSTTTLAPTTTGPEEPSETSTSTTGSTDQRRPFVSPLGAELRRIDLGATPVEGLGIPEADAEYNWAWFNDHSVIENAIITQLSSSIEEDTYGLFSTAFDERFTFEFESSLTMEELRSALEDSLGPDLDWTVDPLGGGGGGGIWFTATDGDRATFAHELSFSIERLDDRWRVRTLFDRSVNLDESPKVPYLGNLDTITDRIKIALGVDATRTGWWARVGFTEDAVHVSYDLFFRAEASREDLVAYFEERGWPLNEAYAADSNPVYSTPETGSFQVWPTQADGTTSVYVYGWTADVPFR
jgi:hypothetical protein